MRHRLVCVCIAIAAGASQPASADSFSSCTVSDPQLVRIAADGTSDTDAALSSLYVFEACGFFWSIDSTSDDTETARELTLDAFRNGQTIGVQCGATGTPCTSRDLAVFDDGFQVIRTVFALDGVSLDAALTFDPSTSVLAPASATPSPIDPDGPTIQGAPLAR